jgi:hypothetical protein
MYAVEFETHIDNGIVSIPDHYQALKNSKKAKVIIMVDDLEAVPKDRAVFTQFLQKHKKVEELTLPTREELHER